MFLAMTKVMIQMVALVLECVEGLVLDLPSRATTPNELKYEFAIDLELCYPTKSLLDFELVIEFHVLD